MTAEYYSSLALVSGAAVYTLAMLVHAAEWAAARTPAVAEVSAAAAPIPIRTLAGAGGPDLPDLPHVSDRNLDGPVPAASAQPALRNARVDALGRSGLALTLVGFVANLTGVVLRGLAADRAPWGNMLEFLTTAMVAVVAAYLVLTWRAGARWLGLPVTALAALANGLAVTVFYVAVAPLVPALHSVWFLIHIVAAAISAAAFNVGALTGLPKMMGTRSAERVR